MLTRITLQKYNVSATLPVSSSAQLLPLTLNNFNFVRMAILSHFMIAHFLLPRKLGRAVTVSLALCKSSLDSAHFPNTAIDGSLIFGLLNDSLKIYTSGYSGIFLCGDLPYWLFLTTHGALRTHPMYLDGKVSYFKTLSPSFDK